MNTKQQAQDNATRAAGGVATIFAALVAGVARHADDVGRSVIRNADDLGRASVNQIDDFSRSSLGTTDDLLRRVDDHNSDWMHNSTLGNEVAPTSKFATRVNSSEGKSERTVDALTRRSAQEALSNLSRLANNDDGDDN